MLYYELTEFQICGTTIIAKTKKNFPACTSSSENSGSKLPALSNVNVKASVDVFPQAPSVPQRDEAAPTTVSLSCTMDTSPSKSDEMLSVSLDETMSTCDSFKSPDVEYIDNTDVSALDSIDRKTFSNLNISENTGPAGSFHIVQLFLFLVLEQCT